MKEYFDRFLAWILPRPRVVMGVLGGTVVTILLLSWLNSALFGYFSTREIGSLNTDVAEGVETIDKLRDRLHVEGGWYVAGYTNGLEENINQARNEFSDAKLLVDTIGEAKGSRAVISQLNNARKLVGSAQGRLKEVTDKLNQLAARKNEVRGILQTAKDQLSVSADKLMGVRQSYVTSSPAYLAKYRDPLKAQIDGAEIKIGNGTQQMNQAQTLLPHDEERRVGDPEQAAALLQQALSLMREADGDLELARARIVYIDNALTNAPARVSEARGTVGSISSWFAGIGGQYEYRMGTARGLLGTAQTYLAEAERQLAAGDYVAAYEAADLALKNANDAQTNARDQIEQEDYKGRWRTAESEAQAEIDANQSPYFGEDSTASANFNEAVSLLSSARGDAGNLRFKDAYFKAVSAKEKASGTAAAAKATHDRHVSETATAEARAAERRAAEEAAERQRQEDERNNPAPSSGGGGYSSGSDSYHDSPSDSAPRDTPSDSRRH